MKNPTWSMNSNKMLEILFPKIEEWLCEGIAQDIVLPPIRKWQSWLLIINGESRKFLGLEKCLSTLGLTATSLPSRKPERTNIFCLRLGWPPHRRAMRALQGPRSYCCPARVDAVCFIFSNNLGVIYFHQTTETMALSSIVHYLRQLLRLSNS